MYVELVTRITTQGLRASEGLLREALSSLYSLFPETRRILRQQGPRVVLPAKANALPFAQIALLVLNRHLRPFLAEWHPRLQSHEATHLPATPPAEHERAWPESATVRAELERLRAVLSS